MTLWIHTLADDGAPSDGVSAPMIGVARAKESGVARQYWSLSQTQRVFKFYRDTTGLITMIVGFAREIFS